MRLTLRTMLAYLDDILEPDDSQDIGKKIEESEFASNLVQRMRDGMRRLRLGVPPLIGRGLAADPNTVAEYLDNTLSAERVPEFEKICLESDVHLAEVASCHQVLTLVLGEQAEISPESRQRMYQLASHVDAPPVQSDALGTPGSGAAPAPASRRAKLEVPDYLRGDTRSRLWPVAAVVLIGALLTFGGLMAFGPAELRERMTALVRGAPAEADAQEAGDSDKSTPAAGQGAAQTPKADETDADLTDPVKPDADGAAKPEVVPPKSPTTDDADAPVAPDPDSSDTIGDKPAKTDMPAAPLPDEPTGPAPPAPKAGLPPFDPPTAPAATPDAVPGKPLAAPGGAPRGEAAADGLGRYISKRDVLLRWDPESSNWKRLPGMAPLAKGDRLLSLPLFRPAVALSSSITIQADGATLFELVGWTDQGVPIISIEYGRLLMLTVGKASNPLQVRVGDLETQITFVDAESTAAIEVRRVLPPGKDPEAGPAPLAVDLYVTSGPLRVTDASGAPAELQAPAHMALFTGRVERPTAGEFPKWVTSEALNDYERGTTAALEPQLLVDRPVDLILTENSTHRRREVRSLAIRSSALLGNFRPCIEALNDKDERTVWQSYFDELRMAIARSPETAAQVRAAFEKLRAPDAAKLYRMLWGYSAEDLRNGADAELVEGLNHDSLDFRELAFLNLTLVTGWPSFGYNAYDTTMKQRTPAVKKWKEKLRKGEILPGAATGSAKSKPTTKAADKPG